MLLYGMKFPLRLNVAVYGGYVTPVLLYGSETWFVKESEMAILRRKERFIVRAICGVQLKAEKYLQI